MKELMGKLYFFIAVKSLQKLLPQLITTLSISQSDPEVSGDITGSKVTCLWANR